MGRHKKTSCEQPRLRRSESPPWLFIRSLCPLSYLVCLHAKFADLQGLLSNWLCRSVGRSVGRSQQSCQLCCFQVFSRTFIYVFPFWFYRLGCTDRCGAPRKKDEKFSILLPELLKLRAIFALKKAINLSVNSLSIIMSCACSLSDSISMLYRNPARLRLENVPLRKLPAAITESSIVRLPFSTRCKILLPRDFTSER